MPFQPGHKINVGRNAKEFQAALKVALHADGEGKRLRQIAEQLVTIAMTGEQWAVKEVADRLDGKSVQQVDANITAIPHEDALEQLAAEGTGDTPSAS